MRRSKYNAKITYVDGIRFQSKRESERYQELKLLEKGGLISQFELQPSFPLFSESGYLIAKYTADFGYLEPNNPLRVIEDVKGARTPVFNLKWKFVKAEYPDFDFRIVK